MRIAYRMNIGNALIGIYVFFYVCTYFTTTVPNLLLTHTHALIAASAAGVMYLFAFSGMHVFT
jgi:hypothetical protein